MNVEGVKGYLYLATVYTLHPQGQEQAWKDACRIAAEVMRMGFCVYSPIAHSHPIAHHGGLDKLDWDLWQTQCDPMIDAAAAILVVRMEGWERSVGITYEIEQFRKAGKPVWYMDP